MGTEAAQYPTMSAAARRTLARLERLEKARRSAQTDGERRDGTDEARRERPISEPSQSGTADPSAGWRGMVLQAPFAAQVIGQALGEGRASACDALLAGIAYRGRRGCGHRTLVFDCRC
jgi:hypothetical protein